MNMRSAVAIAMILPLTSARATIVRDGELAPLKFDGIKDLAVQWALILLNEFWRASFVERPLARGRSRRAHSLSPNLGRTPSPIYPDLIYDRHRLIMEILKAEPDLPIPVPVDQLALQLGITEITEMDSDGFIGGLITNETKSTGVILVNQNLRKERRRFTTGHELGHFLIPTHRPGKDDRFLCSLKDLRACCPCRKLNLAGN
jgi:IrrE N-terminal-like domain